MARFERSKGRRNSKDFTRRDFIESRSRGNSRDRRPRRDFEGHRRGPEMTRVTCSSCGNKCEVPFKPTSDKPIYCDSCFAKKGKSSSSNKYLDIINEKLDKIMEALEIDD